MARAPAYLQMNVCADAFRRPSISFPPVVPIIVHLADHFKREVTATALMRGCKTPGEISQKLHSSNNSNQMNNFISCPFAKTGSQRLSGTTRCLSIELSRNVSFASGEMWQMSFPETLIGSSLPQSEGHVCQEKLYCSLSMQHLSY